MYRGLDKLNLIKIRKGGLVVGLIQFPLLPAVSNYDTHFKSGQNQHENNHLALYSKYVQNTLCRTTMLMDFV